MRNAHFVIPGSPVPLARTRYGNGNIYDSQKEIKGKYAIILDNQHNETPFFKGPLELIIAFYFQIPKTSQKHADKLSHTLKPSRPDLSNLVKLIEDVANELLYKDDAIICASHCFKLYDYQPRTEFIIQEINNAQKFYPFQKITNGKETTPF